MLYLKDKMIKDNVPFKWLLKRQYLKKNLFLYATSLTTNPRLLRVHISLCFIWSSFELAELSFAFSKGGKSFVVQTYGRELFKGKELAREGSGVRPAARREGTS